MRNSKLANLMFSHALSKEYGDAFEVIALHPGVVCNGFLQGISQMVCRFA